jgi:hypothetical protein
MTGDSPLEAATGDQQQVAIYQDSVALDLPEITVEVLLARARGRIDSGVLFLRAAAEDLAAAQSQGAKQREMAKGIARSVGWVNTLLAWRKREYQGTPFGPVSKKSRQQAKVVHANERLKAKVRPESSQASTGSDALGDPAEADICSTAETDVGRDDRGTADAVEGHATTENITRAHLIETLELLATLRPGVRAKLALKVERLRAGLGLTWDQLILPETEIDAAQQNHKEPVS